MYKTTILFGVLLIATGLAGYFGTGAVEKTALIPSGFGVVLLVCGLLASNENRRMLAMHIAVLFGLLGAIGVIPTLLKTLLKEDRSLAALVAKTVTLVLCVVFVGLCVRSFIAARKAREAAAAEVMDESTEDSKDE